MESRHVTERVLAFITLVLILLQTACETGLRDTQVTFTYLYLTIESSNSRAQVGVPIQMRFTITNKGAESFIIESANAPVMDIIVNESGGGSLLSWSEQNPDKVSHRMEWKPGESKVIEITWTPRQQDVYLGGRHDIDVVGYLSSNSQHIQSASVRICASSVCQ